MIFRFGAFELDEDAGELRRDGDSVRVQPKPLALLGLLLRERERIVPLDELFETLWPGTVVTPGSLTRAVSHARRAIGDTHKGETIRSYSRRGYRFCADVVELDAAGAAPVAAAVAAAPAPAAPPDEAGGSFVGRADALESLRRAWGQAAVGRGAIAVISGPPGIGKTRLTEVFSAEMARRGPVNLLARCREGEGVPAFWLWAQVLRQLLEEKELGAEVRELAGAGELAGLVPELGRGAEPERHVSPEQSRFLFFDAFARALSRCSRRRPLLLVLEDVQWAGVPSLRLLEHLAFETAGDPILLVATVRDEQRERGHPLNRTLSILRQQERCEQIALGGFSRREVGQLLEHALGEPPPTDLTSELFARTEGVPLFLREAIRLLNERGDLRDPDRIRTQGITLPGHAIDLIRRTLDSLSEAGAELVGAAAVIGREFGLPLAASVAQMDRGEALDLLDEAARAGVVEPVPSAAATYRFTHALFQEAAYEALGPGARARMHHRTAMRLEQQHGDDVDHVIAELAHHHHRGMAVGDPERAHECALAAAKSAGRVYAYEQQAAHCEQAASALDHVEAVDPKRRLETLLALGEAYRLAAERTRRRSVLTQAMERARSLGFVREFARAAIGFCDISEWGVEDPEALAAVEEAHELLGDEHSIERARVKTRIAYFDVLDRGRTEPIAREAVDLARDLDDPDTLMEALYTLHFIIGGPDHLEERAAISEEIVATGSDQTGNDAGLIAVLDVACDYLTFGDAAGGRRKREEAETISGENPHLGLVWNTRVYDTGLALLEGRFDEVEERAALALEAGRRIGHPYAQACYNAHIVMLARDRGRHADAIATFERALRARHGPGDWVQAVVARSQLALGQTDEAAAALDALAANDFKDIPRNLRWPATIVEVAGLCADLDHAEHATRLCDLLGPVEALHGVMPMVVCYGGPVSHMLARLFCTLGRTDEALELFEEAVQGCRALGAKPALARVHLGTASLLARRSDRVGAREHLDAATALAGELGLAREVEAAAALAARLQK